MINFFSSVFPLGKEKSFPLHLVHNKRIDRKSQSVRHSKTLLLFLLWKIEFFLLDQLNGRYEQFEFVTSPEQFE